MGKLKNKLKIEKIKESISNSLFIFAFNKMEKNARVKIVLAQMLQTILALMDFLGVLVIGVMSSLAISGVSNGVVGDRVARFINLIGIDGESLQVQVGVLGIVAAVFLCTKTILSFFITRKTLLYLSMQGANYSANLVKEMLSRKLGSIHEDSIQYMIYSITGGARAITVGIIGGWFSLLSDLVLLLILGGGLFILDSSLTLFVLLFYILIAILIHKNVAKRLKNLGDRQAELSVLIGERVSEVYLSYREIYVRNRRNFYSDFISKTGFETASNSALIGLTSAASKYVFELAFVAGSLLISGYAFITRPVSSAVGVLAIFLASSTRIVPALLRIQQGIASIRLQTGYAKPTIEWMKKTEKTNLIEMKNSSFSRDHRGFFPEIRVKDLSFKFHTNEDWNLFVHEFNVEKGEFVALVGSSGAGKTTLVDLLLGLREPDKGSIKISGVSPDDAISNFPGAIAYMPQDISIFPGSIRRNLCIGFEEKEIEENFLWEALEKAELSSFVRGLPNGLETEVGERGTRISGGQRQRLGLARAFVSLPRLVILDEATSMLDAEVEAAISDSIRAMKGNTTLVVIAHRLSTVRNADRLYFLKNGRIKGAGNFEDLKAELPDFARQANLLGL